MLINVEKLERDFIASQDEFQELKMKYVQLLSAQKEKEDRLVYLIIESSEVDHSEEADHPEDDSEYWKLKIQDIASDASLTYNEQQNQLQGVESVIEIILL